MAEFDDTDKKAKPLSEPLTARHKVSKKNAVNITSGKEGKMNALYQRNSHTKGPEENCILAQQGSRDKRTKKEPRIDPYMVRQAKLKASKGESK